MKKYLLLLTSLVLASCASSSKDFNREPNQVGGGGGNVGSVDTSSASMPTRINDFQ